MEDQKWGFGFRELGLPDLRLLKKWRAAGGFCTWEMARTKTEAGRKIVF